MHFRPFPVFWAYVFLSGKSADPNPPPLLVKIPLFFFFFWNLPLGMILKKLVEFSTKRGGGGSDQPIFH